MRLFLDYEEDALLKRNWKAAFYCWHDIFSMFPHKGKGQFSSWSVSGISPMNILVLENITRAKIKIIIIVIKLSCTSNE